MFGGPKQFGASSPFGAQTQSTFGKPAFGQQPTAFGQQPSMFGSPSAPTTGMFGAPAATPAFGATAAPAFGTPAVSAATTGFGNRPCKFIQSKHT